MPQPLPQPVVSLDALRQVRAYAEWMIADVKDDLAFGRAHGHAIGADALSVLEGWEFVALAMEEVADSLGTPL